MSDIYLDLSMHGGIISEKSKKLTPRARMGEEMDKFELAEDQLLKDFLDASLLNEDPSTEQFTPPSIKRAKRKEELKAISHSLSKRDLHLEVAFELLSKEGPTYVEEEKYQELIDQFAHIAGHLNKLDFSKPLREKLHTLLHISDSTIETILKIALTKYNEMQFEASLSLFSLLTCLNFQNELYWYLLGIAASQLEQLDLALEAFAYAIYLNADLLGARIFSAECYLRQDKMSDAKAELEEAKKIVKGTSPEQIWLDLLSNLEEQIN